MKKLILASALMLGVIAPALAEEIILVTKTGTVGCTGVGYNSVTESHVKHFFSPNEHKLVCSGCAQILCKWVTEPLIVSPIDFSVHMSQEFENIVLDGIGSGHSSGDGSIDGIDYSWSGSDVNNFTLTITGE